MGKTMFYSFKTQDERRAYGGSDFIELQYCKLKPDTKLKKIVSDRAIGHWNDDSLYIYADDIDAFLSCYNDIFGGATYANMEKGNLDIYGINYYSPEKLRDIISKIERDKPAEYAVLSEWLNKGKEYNGFYVLGI